MPRIGFKNLYAAVMDEATDVDGGVVTYQAPFKISNAITGGFTPQTSEASLYSDDSQSDYISNITGYDITLNTRDLTPAVEAKLLGLDVDKNGGISHTSRANAPYVALMFESDMSDGKTEFNVFYKVKFNPIQKDVSTKGENIEFQTPSITGRAIPRIADELIDFVLIGGVGAAAGVKTVTDAWYTAPVKPTPVTIP